MCGIELKSPRIFVPEGGHIGTTPLGLEVFLDLDTQGSRYPPTLG